MKRRTGVPADGRTPASGLRVLILALLCASVRPCAGASQVPITPQQQQPQDARQDSIDAQRDSIIRSRPRGDSIRPVPPITPGTAFLRSLVLPGWGQASLHRNVTGGVFVAFEGLALTMFWKSSWQLNYARTRQKYVKSHLQEKQDWLALVVFNHLMAGAEAFVAAHLYDFPASLKAQVMPDGRTGVGVNVPF
jgi:hypothetical protein